MARQWDTMTMTRVHTDRLPSHARDPSVVGALDGGRQGLVSVAPTTTTPDLVASNTVTGDGVPPAPTGVARRMRLPRAAPSPAAIWRRRVTGRVEIGTSTGVLHDPAGVGAGTTLTCCPTSADTVVSGASAAPNSADAPFDEAVAEADDVVESTPAHREGPDPTVTSTAQDGVASDPDAAEPGTGSAEAARLAPAETFPVVVGEGAWAVTCRPAGLDVVE
jgi:hypothetical protein